MNRPQSLEQFLGPPERWRTLDLAAWDGLLREARRAEVLPRLAVLLAESGGWESVPAQVQEHLVAAQVVAAKHAVTMRWELTCIARALADLDAPVVLLKGAAYLAAGLPPARGRTSSDVDLLVPKTHRDAAEAALVAHGWRSVKLHPYDQRYYRQWMHELPPLEHEVRCTVVDLHHTILPETSRLHPDADKLLAASQPLPDSPYRVLAPEDMVLHSAAHLLQDDDFSGGVRGLLDLDDLLRHYGPDERFWDRLVPRARELDLQRPLFYALRFTRRFLQTPIPQVVLADAAADGPPWPVGPWMDRLAARAVQPRDVESLGLATATARWLLYVRGHWLRMPPLRLASHLTHKALRRWHREPEPDADDPPHA